MNHLSIGQDGLFKDSDHLSRPELKTVVTRSVSPARLRLKRSPGLWLVALSYLLLGLSAKAFQAPTQAPPVNFDKRHGALVNRQPPTEEQASTITELKRRAPGLKVEIDPITRSPKTISNPAGFLTGPGGVGVTTSKAEAAAFPDNEPHRATKAFLKEHKKLFGHGAEALEQARVQREFTGAHNGLKTVVWEQQLDGLPIFEAVLISHTTAKGELVSLSSQFIANPQSAGDKGTKSKRGIVKAPLISARQAIVLAARNLGEAQASEATVETSAEAGEGPGGKQKFKASFLRGESEARLVWLPVDADALRPCWDVLLNVQRHGEMFRILIDIETGEALLRRCLTVYISDASFRVFTSDSPSPFSPGHPVPMTNQPALVPRSLLTFPALDTNASPSGWIDDGINETRGNNVDAHTDRNNDDFADLPRPAGSPFRVFDFPMDLTSQDPAVYTNASVAQLFYRCNWMHDKLYQLGFTEAAGNFQTANFGRGGLGNDALQADAQDGGGFNNANMYTPADGSPPRMQMYIFSGSTPRRDAALDSEIVLHEYTHGLSNRRVGGGIGISALQTEGMGEGWSDFYALTLLSEAGDDVNGVYAKGGYSTYQFTFGFTQNYYYDIRRYPYSTDLSKNPLTFKDIDPSQASSHSGVPHSPAINGSADEVHSQGEVWCVTLWEARANLINRYGYSVGNQLILQLVTDGMNLSPGNPNFLQARDAIIQADLVNNGGANRRELWTAFAKRGMGISATSPSSSFTSGVHESFDVPDDLVILPADGFTANGPVGGPFVPSSLTLTLTNSGTGVINWTMGNTSSWLTVSASSGSLPPGGGTAVAAGLNSSVFSLVKGIYSATVRFTNLVTGFSFARQFTIRVGQPEYFTELFSELDNDLDFKTFTFTPNGSSGFYSACSETATNYPSPTNNAIPFVLGNHSTKLMVVSNGANVSIYGLTTNQFYLSSDGHITFGAADSSGSATLVNHFSRPRISGLFAHLHPSDGGVVLWLQLSNRVAITFERVYDYDSGLLNSFQMELFFDGRIRLTYLNIGIQGGLAGLSAGNGLPSDFVESDFSGYAQCTPPFRITAPTSATEGNGVLAGAGQIVLPFPLATNLTLTLSSSDTTEVTVPATITIPAGQTNAPFNITIVDDSILDGTQSANISAVGPGFVGSAATIQVHDNESAVLQVSLPSTLTEGNSATQGVVRVSAAPAVDVVVSMLLSVPPAVQVPPIVILPAGQTSTVFPISIIDDNLIDGPQITVVTAHVQNWTDGSASVTVLDNETLDLTVSLPSYAGEGNGVLPNAGQIRLSGVLQTNLEIALLSSDTSELILPPTIVIPAGQFSVFFPLIVVDDAAVDGNQMVTVTASAGGFNSGSASMVIVDDESPPLPANPYPPNLASNIAANLTLSWTGCGGGISNEVYLGTHPDLGPGDYAGTTTNCNWVAGLLAPNTTYYWQIASRTLGTTLGPVWRFTTRGVDHFDLAPVASTQYMGQAFSLTVTARDEFNRVVTNFSGPVSLAASGGPQSKIFFADNFEDGTFSDWIIGSDVFVRAVTNDTAAGGVYSFSQIGPPSINHYGGVSHALSNITPSRITFYVRSGANTLASGYFVAGQSTASPAFFFYMRDTGMMGLAGNSGEWYGVPYVARQWYKITLVLDWSGFLIDYYVNDVIAYSKVPFRSIVPSLSDVYLYNFHNSQAWWDEIQMTGGGTPAPLLLSTTNSGPFTNGAWSGNLAVLQPSSNAVLTVTDTQGHSGTGNAFTVLPYNDLSVFATATPDPVDVGAVLTYTVRVDNSGPATATNVRLTNLLSAQLSVLNYSASQGSCTLAGNTIICNLGSIATGSFATLSFTGSPLASGSLTNISFATRAELDAYTNNNSALLTTTVRPPTVFAFDGAVEEGDFGLTNAQILIRLSTPANQPVSVAFTTFDGTASSGIDFPPTNGVVVFPPGTTNQILALPVFGDTFAENNEYFYVSFYSASNAILGSNQVRITIINDDNIPGKLHHFVWSPVPSPQTVSVPFRASITAQDAFNNTVTNFTGSVTLASNGGQTNSILASPVYTDSGSGNYTLGYSFTPSTDITVTHVRHIFGTKVSIWNDSGALLAAQTVSSIPGTWVDTPLTTPLQLTSGTRYRIGAYTGGGNYYWRDLLGPAFPNGTIDGGYYNTGDSFPSITNSVRWWFVDLRYSYGSTTNVPVTPSITTAFTNGAWAGNIAVLAQATNLVLRAADPANHAGNSNPFNVSASNQPPIILTQPVSQVVSVGSTASFGVSVFGTPPMLYQWQRNGVNVPGATNATLTLSGLTTNQAGTYRVTVSNSWGGLVSAGALLTVSDFPVVAVFDDPNYVDTSGATSAESDNVQASLTNLNFFVTTFTNWATAATNNTVLLVPDLEIRSLAPDLTPTVQAILSNFVQAGGLLIVHGDAGARSSALLNTVFGFTISQSGLSTGTTPHYLTTAASGTSFAGGPASLSMNDGSATLYTSTLPPGSLSIYESSGQSLVALIPFGNGTIVYLGWDWYDAAPRGIQNGGWLPVLASAVNSRIPLAPEPIIRQQPVSRNVFSGASVNFSVVVSGASPLRFQWRKDGVSIPAATNSNYTISSAGSGDAGLYSVLITNSYGSALSSNAALTVVTLPPDAEFQILSLGTNNSRVIDHNALTGDDRGGIAASTSQLLYSGDSSSARFALSDLSGGTALNRIFDALTSDLRTGTIYSLANGTTPLTGASLPITALLEHDATTGLLNGSSIQLSSAIPLSGSAGIFAGYGRIVIHTGTRAYNISLPSGIVTDLGAMSPPSHQSSENWAYWGIAEYVAGTVYMVYVRDSQTISRTAVPSGTTTTVASFSSLSDMASFTVSIPFGRWYFHHEYSSQFGGVNETIGYADAQFIVTSGTNPPTILTQPVGQSVKAGTNVMLSVVVQGSSGYQWRKDGTNLANGGRITGANSSSLMLSNVLDTDSGLYSVLVTNLYGSVLSSNALLVVSALDHFSWSAIASPEFAKVPFTVSIQARDAANKLLTNFTGSVSLKGLVGGAQTTNDILGAVVHSSFSTLSGNYTLGYSFTPNTNITVTHVRSYYGTKVSIWSDSGTLLASQSVALSPGVWTDTPLSSPLALTGGSRYRVGVYVLNGYNYYWRSDMGSNFPAGTIIQSYEGSSDTFPTSTDSIRWWLVDLRYTKGTQTQLPLNPSVSGSFVQGVWSGLVEIPQTATNLTLLADNGLGQSGESNPINVLNQPRLDVQRYEDVMLIVWPVNSSTLILECSQTLNPPVWLKVPNSPLRIDDQFVVPVQLDQASGFYRLRRADP